MAYVWMSVVGIANSKPGSYEEAIAWSRRAIEANRNYAHSYVWMAATLANLDRLGEARAAAPTGLTLNPTFSILRGGAVWKAMSGNPTPCSA